MKFRYHSLLKSNFPYILFLLLILLLQSLHVYAKQQSPTQRIQAHFEKAGVTYPPKKITLIGIKDKKILELWAQNKKNNWKLIHTYPILAASGKLGPKLKEGDQQVPEGIYKILWLNPNSKYHLSMKLNYPNEFDLKKAKLDKRTQPGSDIFIHGKNVSIGCLAIGDRAIEELYKLVQKIGVNQAEVILTPVDMRFQTAPTSNLSQISWINELYQNIAAKMIKIH